MLFLFKTIRHYIDYLIGMIIVILPAVAAFLISSNILSDEKYDGVDIFELSIPIAIGGWCIVGFLMQAMEDAGKELTPEKFNKFKIQLRGDDVDKSYECKAYSINHCNDHIELTADGTKSDIAHGVSVIVTNID